MMELDYRPATDEDIQEIYRLCEDLIRRYEDPEQVDFSKVLPWVQKKISDNISQYTCVWTGDAKAGYFRTEATDTGVELDDLYVLPAFQGQGIGSQILNKCIQDTDRSIYLYVFLKNERAIALYQRFGFKMFQQVSATRGIMLRHT